MLCRADLLEMNLWLRQRPCWGKNALGSRLISYFWKIIILQEESMLWKQTYMLQKEAGHLRSCGRVDDTERRLAHPSFRLESSECFKTQGRGWWVRCREPLLFAKWLWAGMMFRVGTEWWYYPLTPFIHPSYVWCYFGLLSFFFFLYLVNSSILSTYKEMV